MTKKVSDTKLPKKQAASSPEAERLTRYLALGNYFLARRLGTQLLGHVAEGDRNRNIATYALRISWPDTVALLVGGACFLVTAVVAFVVAY